MTTETENKQHDVAETPGAIPQFYVLPGGRSTPVVTTPSNQSSQRKIEANRRNALSPQGRRRLRAKQEALGIVCAMVCSQRDFSAW